MDCTDQRTQRRFGRRSACSAIFVQVLRKLLRIGTVFVLALAAALPAAGATAQDAELAPIPDMYVGSWSHHSAGVLISRSDAFPQAGNAIVQWRTYTWCQDTLTNKQNPPPCDMIVNNEITDGGIASILLLHPQGQDDATLSGVVEATSDPGGFGDQGADVEFTMLPGNMLQLTANGQSTMFCGPNTDLSQYPPSPCGA